MRKESLGQRLRAIVLATPFVAGMACGGPQFNCGPCPTQSLMVALQLTDAGGCDCSAQLRETQSCDQVTLPDGGPGMLCVGTPWCLCGGRRPAGLLASSCSNAAHPIGALFAEMSRLEAASVRAFHVLARELAEHGAPTKLVTAALRSASDEVRHTRSTAAIARRYGAAPLRPRYSVPPYTRPLAAIAKENAVEGCVGETYGALVALWQGEHAADPHIARSLRAIAKDEVRHAELAWSVARWVEPQLTPRARNSVNLARAEAVERLSRAPQPPLGVGDVLLAGWPPPHLAHQLRDALAPELAAG